jgi:hypothetical protein
MFVGAEPVLSATYRLPSAVGELLAVGARAGRLPRRSLIERGKLPTRLDESSRIQRPGLVFPCRCVESSL